MWAHPWGAWPLQQSAYANMPSEQIDWAELAKQWIAQKEAMSSGTGEDPSAAAAGQPPPPPPPPPPPQQQAQQQQAISSLQQIPQSQQHTVPPPPPPYPPLPSEMKPSSVGEGGPDSGREADSHTTNGAGTSAGGTGHPAQPLLLEHIPHPLQSLHPPGETQNEMDISDGENEGNRDTSFKNLSLPNQPIASNLALMNQPPPPTQPMSGEWNWNMANWNVPPHQGSAPPPPAWNIQHHQVQEHEENQSYDYGNSNFHQTYDYNHGNDQFRYQQSDDNWRHDSNQNRNFRSNRGNRSRSPTKVPHLPTNTLDDTGIDATKRKNLPAWIREGLEKMERDKQKKLEKERKDKEQIEALKAQENADRDAEGVMNENVEEKRSDNEKEPPFLPSKSRFESDEEGSAKMSDNEPRFSKSEKSSPSPDEFKTEEEKQAELQIKVRRYLTEILLEVTNNEIESIAKEVYFKARNRAAKAPAKQLAKSTALASLSSLGVGSDSGSDDDEEGIGPKIRKPTDNDSDEESDNALHERIRQRQLSRQQHRNFSSSESDSEQDSSPTRSREKSVPSHSEISNRKSDKIPGMEIKFEAHKEKSENEEISKEKSQSDIGGGDTHVQGSTKELKRVKKEAKSRKKSAKKKSASSSSTSSSSTSSSSSSSSSSSVGRYSESDSDSSDSSSDSSSSNDTSSSSTSSSSDKKHKLLKAVQDGRIHGDVLNAYLKNRERGKLDNHPESGSGDQARQDPEKYRRSESQDSYQSTSYDRQHSSHSRSDRYGSRSDRYNRDSSRHKTDSYYEEKYDRYKYGTPRNGNGRRSSKDNYDRGSRDSAYAREGSYGSIGSPTSSRNRRTTTKRRRSLSDSSDSERSSSKRRNSKSNADHWYEQRSERYKHSRERSDYDRSGKRSSRKHKSRSRSRSRYR